jgi:retron-type reverse transcriptase
MSAVFSGGGRCSEGVFHEVCSLANLFVAWNEFKSGKRKKDGVSQFELRLEENLFRLHEELTSKTYHHEPYEAFYVCDPKRRHIHKASVRDRVMHQALFRVLYPIFDKHFIHDSYSSRNDKGTHKGVERLEVAVRKVSKNWKSKAWTLKCDIRKFFDSIDHALLRKLILQKVEDQGIIWLLDLIFASFSKEKGKGLPLGNVTSQLFANVYLNELDQFAKHVLKAKYYFRYCDDFVIVHENREFLEKCVEGVAQFLEEKLRLQLHPHKVEIRKVSQGIDFLGYVILPHAIVLRTKTKKRIKRKVKEGVVAYGKNRIKREIFTSIISSYLGVFSHAKSRKATGYLRMILEKLRDSP